MTDRILAALALVSLLAFMSVLVWFLKEIDLTIVIVGAFALAAFDFFFYRSKNRARSRD